jgi:hypothetical protein
MMMLTAKRIERRLLQQPGHYLDGIVRGLYLVVEGSRNAHWSLRYQLNGRERYMGLGSAHVLSLKAARERAREARQLLLDKIDPLEVKRVQQAERALLPAKTLHERVARKFASLLEQGIEPQGYLYRHYHPNGDLLYVGITLSVLDRTSTHLSEAGWRDVICLIVVEPFATREQALEAEQLAIKTEFPKFNRTHNGHRHPMQELRRLQKRAVRAGSDELRQIRRMYKSLRRRQRAEKGSPALGGAGPLDRRTAPEM